MTELFPEPLRHELTRSQMDRILLWCVEKRASDIVFCPGDPVWMEQDGVWMLGATGHEISGCCMSASLKDYARFGQFNMNGDGFEGFVKADDVVKAGQPLLKIDRAKIAAAGYKDCVVVAVSNTAEFADVELTVEAESAVAAGDAIVKVVRK